MVTKIVGVLLLLGIILRLEAKDADDSGSLSEESRKIRTCIRPKCRDHSETLCAKYKNFYRYFAGKCEILINFCETGEKYKVISGDCPPDAYNGPFPCNDKEDLICAKSDNETLLFQNYCKFNNHLYLTLKPYDMVPLSACIGLPNAPIDMCTKVGGLPPGEVCAFYGADYRLFPDWYAYNYEKCFVNGIWRTVAYC